MKLVILATTVCAMISLYPKEFGFCSPAMPISVGINGEPLVDIDHCVGTASATTVADSSKIVIA